MTTQPKLPRLPKGQRKHIRRLKETAIKEGTTYRPQKIRRAPAKITGA